MPVMWRLLFCVLQRVVARDSVQAVQLQRVRRESREWTSSPADESQSSVPSDFPGNGVSLVVKVGLNGECLALIYHF